MEMKRRMALNFDLNLYLLKKHYLSKQYTKAYGDIGRFLKKMRSYIDNNLAMCPKIQFL